MILDSTKLKEIKLDDEIVIADAISNVFKNVDISETGLSVVGISTDYLYAEDSNIKADVKVEPVDNSGEKIATITVNGVPTEISAKQIDVDDSFSFGSTNPVQNKKITNALFNSVYVDEKIKIQYGDKPISFYGKYENEELVIYGSYSNGLYYANPNNVSTIEKCNLIEVEDGFDLDIEKNYFDNDATFKYIIEADDYYVALDCKHYRSYDPLKPDEISFCKIYKSIDGKRWKLMSVLNGYGNLGNNILSYNGEYYVCKDNGISYSADLVTWQQVDLTESTTPGCPRALGYIILGSDNKILCFPTLTHRIQETAQIFTFDPEEKTFSNEPRCTLKMPDDHIYDRVWTHIWNNDTLLIGIGIRKNEKLEFRAAQIVSSTDNFKTYLIETAEYPLTVPRYLIKIKNAVFALTYTGQIYQKISSFYWQKIYEIGYNIEFGVFDGMYLYLFSQDTIADYSPVYKLYLNPFSLSHDFMRQDKISFSSKKYDLTNCDGVIDAVYEILTTFGVNKDSIIINK